MKTYSTNCSNRSTGQTRIIRRGPFTLDLDNQTIQFQGNQIELPPCAFSCLAVIVCNYPLAVSFQALAKESLGVRLGDLEAQDYARWRMERLRKALETDPQRPRYLCTVPGFGYRLKLD